MFPDKKLYFQLFQKSYGLRKIIFFLENLEQFFSYLKWTKIFETMTTFF